MHTRVCTMLILGLIALPAVAQLGRVEDGRAGDANLRIGSGGYNPPLKPRYRSYSNEIVTGNVRGGRSFQGLSPIGSTTDFGSSLGSTTLDRFRRDSVGVDDIRSGYRPYLPRPFYSRSGAVNSVGGYAVGFRAGAPPPRFRTYVHFPSDPRTPGSDLSGPYSRQILVGPRSDVPGPTPSRDAAVHGREYAAPRTRSSLFGVAPDPSKILLGPRLGLDLEGPADRIEPYSRLRPAQELPAAEAAPEITGAGEFTEALQRTESALDRVLGPARATTSVRTELQRRRDSSLGSLIAPERERLSSYTRTYREDTADRQRQPEPGAAPVGAEGDVYRTMLQAASMVKDVAPSAEKGQGPAVPAARREQDESQTDPTGPGEQTAAPGPLTPKQQQDRLRELLAKPVVTFAGTAKTLANEAFKEAEAHLKAGEYFRARTDYDRARAADPSNPLIWIGRGHALIGAGDYRSASDSIEEGLRRFPQITRFRIDLKAFLSHQDILDIRRADLEKRLERNESYRMRFLLGYIEYFSGLEKFGLPNLIKAAKEAPVTSPITRFPEMLAKKATPVD